MICSLSFASNRLDIGVFHTDGDGPPWPFIVYKLLLILLLYIAKRSHDVTIIIIFGKLTK